MPFLVTSHVRCSHIQRMLRRYGDLNGLKAAYRECASELHRRLLVAETAVGATNKVPSTFLLRKGLDSCLLNDADPDEITALSVEISELVWRFIATTCTASDEALIYDSASAFSSSVFSPSPSALAELMVSAADANVDSSVKTTTKTNATMVAPQSNFHSHSQSTTSNSFRAYPNTLNEKKLVLYL